MTGTVTDLQRNRGVGTLVGENGRTYVFRRHDVCDGWFHDLADGARVSFEPKDPPKQLEATRVRLLRPS